jgi:WD40 repeat protein
MKWSQEKGFYDISKRVYINEAEWELVGREDYEPSRTSPDGYRKFIWSDDRKTLQIMDVTRNQIIAGIKHTGPIGVAAFHPYGRLILWAGGENFLYLWNLESEKIVTKLQTKGTVTACAVTEDELIICGDSLGYVYLVETPHMPGRVKDNPSSVKTAGEHVSEILNIMGEKKDKITDFVKEKMGSAKDATGFVKGKIDSAKDVISNRIRPWRKKVDE